MQVKFKVAHTVMTEIQTHLSLMSAQTHLDVARDNDQLADQLWTLTAALHLASVRLLRHRQGPTRTGSKFS